MKLHSHVSTTRTAAERGAELAAAFAEPLRANVFGYLAFFKALGIPAGTVRDGAESAFEALAAWRPRLGAELRALADGAGLEHWQLSAVNARTEILAAAQEAGHECSTIVFAPEHGAGWGMQTWDWHPSLVHDGLAWELRTESGRTVKLFTEFGAQGKIGVNDAGIGVHFNILSHRSDHGMGGVPVHSIARALLEDAASLDEARDIVRSAGVSASTALTVLEVDADGSRAASFELSPEGIGEVLPDAAGLLTRTNHFLSPELTGGETIALDESKTHERLALLRSVAQHAADLGENAAARAETLYAGGDGTVLCFVPGADLPDTERWQTLVTIGTDVSSAALDISLQAPGPTTSFTRF